MMKKILFFLFLSVATLQCFCQNQQQGLEDALRKLSMAHIAIANLYVDEVNTGKLTEDAIDGMLSKLDPHSSYTNA